MRSAPSFCVTAVDFPGFGRSPAPIVPVDLQYYVDEVAALMRHYNMEDVVVVAHSFGARVAIRLAVACDRVAGLVLVGAAGLRPRRSVRYYARILRAKWCHLCHLPRPKGSTDYENLSGPMRRTFVNIVNTYQDREVRHVRCPVLLVWGTEDTQTPLYMLHRFERLLPQSHTVLMEGCDHFCFARQPARFDALVKEFANNLCESSR